MTQSNDAKGNIILTLPEAKLIDRLMTYLDYLNISLADLIDFYISYRNTGLLKRNVYNTIRDRLDYSIEAINRGEINLIDKDYFLDNLYELENNFNGEFSELLNAVIDFFSNNFINVPDINVRNYEMSYIREDLIFLYYKDSINNSMVLLRNLNSTAY